MKVKNVLNRQYKKDKHDKTINRFTHTAIKANNKATELTSEFQNLLKDMIDDSLLSDANKIGQQRINFLGEIMITFGDKSYNLTQMLSHEPDFNSLVLDDKLLDHFYDYLRSGSGMMVPENFLSLGKLYTDDL